MKKISTQAGLVLPPCARKLLLMFKFTCLLSLVFFQVSAAGYSQNKVSIDIKNATVSRILHYIEKNSDYVFYYSNNELEKLPSIDLRLKDVTISRLLDSLSTRLGIHYSIINDKLVVIGREGVIQIKEISGRVVNARGEPLIGITVQIKGSSQGTTTDANGKFTLEIPDNATLVLSGIGYLKKEVVVGGRNTLSITLQEDVAGLNEVVVIGYGTRKKKDLTGSVVTVKDDIVKNRPVANLNEALVGQLAGVNIALNDGSPGGETSIRIRGVGSISAGNEPLYVIDGFPTTQAFANTLLPSSIESFSVLKDASATAIYGSRGSNGVILITTKSGVTGSPVISVNISTGLAHVLHRDYYHLLDGRQYIEFTKESRNNQWISAGAGHQASDPNSIRPVQYQIPDFLNTYNGINTNWQNEIFREALVQNYDINVRGGSDRIKYLFSTGYYNNEGVLLGSGYKKYTAQLKLDASLIKNVLDVGMNLIPSFVSQDLAQYSGTSVFNSVIASALAMPPIIPVYNADGSYADNMQPPAGFYPIPNPVQLGKELKNHNVSISNLFNTYLKWNILPTLEVRTTLGATLDYARNDSYHPSTVPNPFSVPPVNPTGSSSTSDVYNWLSETTLNYQKVFSDKHRLNILAGFSSQKEHAHSNSVSANSYPNDLVQTLNAGVVTGGNSFESEWSLISGYGRLNYSYDDKYLLTATFRADGSSRFGKNTKWGYFPSAAAGWVISREDFLNDSKVLSLLKLRASYGISGNNNIGNYAHVGLLGYTNQTFGSGAGMNYSGIYPTSLSNEDLTWEKSAELDIGLDIGLIEDRFSLTFDYYDRKSSDLLLNVNLPTTTGFSSVLTNIGKVQNKGYEIMLNSMNITAGSFQWYTAFNLSFNKNKVLQLGLTGDPIYDFSGTRVTAVGSSIGANRGLKQIGVLTQKEINAGVPVFPGEKAGDAKYFDANHDGVISNFNGDDGIFLGDANPHYLFGLNNRFEYKGFDLNIMINGQTGGWIMDLTSQGLWDPAGTNAMYKQYAGRYISESNPGNGWTIRPGNVNGGTPDTRLVQSSDYLRIRNVAIGYSFPGSKIRHVKGLRAFISAENVITWKKSEGYNPQSTAFGSAQSATINGLTGGGSYPLPFTISIGLNFSLQ